MADGYRFPQSAGSYYYPQQTQPHHHPRHLARNGSPPSAIRSGFTTETPSPSRSPDLTSTAQGLYGMFNQGHQPGQHGRVNGTTAGQRIPMMYNFQHQNAHQQQTHSQHHQTIQQDHNVHNTNGSGLGHHTTYSSGAMSHSTPSFTPNNLQNGHSATTRGGQAQQLNENWVAQLELHRETKLAHHTMINEHSPNHYARTKGHENRSLTSETTAANLAISNTALDGDTEDRGRPSNSAVTSKRQDWHSMDMSGQGLKVLTSPVFAYTFLNELYIASNAITSLPAAIGNLRHLSYLDASNNLLTSLPPELGMCVYLKNLLLFDNVNLRHIPKELGYLYQLEMLGIEGSPIPAEYKQILMEKGTKALVHELRETSPVPAPPLLDRAMIDIIDESSLSSSQESIRVFSHNTLCEKYATEQQYGYTPSLALAWPTRKQKILDNIQQIDADIVCLQEVDSHNFNEYFCQELAYGDYKGVFWPKSRAKTMNENDAKAVDGCATFYKGSKYILLDKQLIGFSELAINRPDMKNQHDIFNRVMPRDDIATICFFENRQTGSRFIVVNAHIYWNPVYSDVKIIQTAILLESLTKQAAKYARWPACKDKKTYALSDENEIPSDIPPPKMMPSMEYSGGTQIPLIICSDLNSRFDSGVCDLLALGSLKGDHPDMGKHQYGNFTRDGMQHPFSLKSAYMSLKNDQNDLPFTNYTPAFIGVIDYIWYSSNCLEVTKLLGPIDSEYLKRVPGFPHYHFPSDHIQLVAEFIVKPSANVKKVSEVNFGPQRDRR